MFRYRKSTKKYAHHHDERCPFCYPPQERVIKEATHYRILQTSFPYDIWEFRDVTEHYMVVPKRHVKSLGELNAVERADIMDVIAEYESQDFNIYARSRNSVQRTVAMHQHTHLIKTKNRHAKIAFYAKKPYILVKF